jgi:thioester reductase-like protein
MNDAVLLTGATGFLGMELLARWLAEDDGPDVFLAVRADGDAGARERVDDLLARLYDDVPAPAQRLRPVRAELTAQGLGLRPADRRALTGAVSRIVHCAASISFTLPLGEARAINVGGTRGVLDLARATPGLERLVHVSTAYVAGRHAGLHRETDLDVGQDFRNTYEQTKLEAEQLVGAADDLPSAVVRPSIVVGEADSGWTSAFNVIYWPLQAFARGLFRDIPADPDGVVDLVPVDHVARLLDAVTFAPEASGTYSAVAAGRATRVADLIELACRLLGRPKPLLSAPGSLPDDHPATAFAPYFDVATTFDDARARALTGERAPAPASYFDALLGYGAAARWGKRPQSREAARRALPAAAAA